MKNLRRKEAQHAAFGHRSNAERKHTGRFHVEKWSDDRNAWVLMSAGEADDTAPAGKELRLLIRRAEVIEGKTRIVQSRTGEVVWPAEPLGIDAT